MYVYVIIYICIMYSFAISLFIFNRAAEIVCISGKSMEPTLYNDDLLILFHKKPNVGDIVIFKFSKSHLRSLNISEDGTYRNTIYVKRVIAAGSSNDDVYVIGYRNIILVRQNSRMILYPSVYNSINHIPANKKFVYRLKENEFFVIGDNYKNSIDSRYYGPITKDEIIATRNYNRKIDRK